jgi:hypothetical protein
MDFVMGFVILSFTGAGILLAQPIIKIDIKTKSMFL